MRQVYQYPLTVQLTGRIAAFFDHFEEEHWKPADHGGTELETVVEQQLRGLVEALLGDLNTQITEGGGGLVLTLS